MIDGCGATEPGIENRNVDRTYGIKIPDVAGNFADIAQIELQRLHCASEVSAYARRLRESLCVTTPKNKIRGR